MLKALFKKQLMEVNVWLLQNRKTGQRRSARSIAGQILLYAFVFVLLGFVFFMLGIGLGQPLHAAGLDWLFFAIVGLIALMLGLFGSVFNTSATLYQAKDNDLLLSMPIPPRMVLTVRLLGVWMWSLIYVGLVFFPASLSYWIFCGFTWGSLPGVFFSLLALATLALVLSCLLGWVVAKITARLKKKSFVTVLASLLFLAAYYFIYYRASAILSAILLHVQEVARIAQKVFPLYWLGRGAAGDAGFLLLFVLLVALALCAVFWVMSRSFLKLAFVSSGNGKRKQKKLAIRSRSLARTLLRKERQRYTASPTYMLNCSLGILFLPVLGVLAIAESGKLLAFAELVGLTAGTRTLLGCAVVCMLSSMNDITAPSISLEGKMLWIAQSLPIPAWQVLRAKLSLHLLLTLPPIAVCSGCLCIALRADALSCVLLFLVPMVFCVLSAAFGLFVNLKAPNLTWTSEVVPIKQSGSVTLALLGGWAFVLLLGGLYFLLGKALGALGYLLLCTALLALLSTALLLWLKTRGARRFSSL